MTTLSEYIEQKRKESKTSKAKLAGIAGIDRRTYRAKIRDNALTCEQAQAALRYLNISLVAIPANAMTVILKPEQERATLNPNKPQGHDQPKYNNWRDRLKSKP